MSTFDQCEEIILPIINTFGWEGRIIPLDGMKLAEDKDDEYAVQIKVEGENITYYPLLEVYTDAINQEFWVWWYGGEEHMCYTKQEVRRMYKKIAMGWFRHGR